MRLAGTVVVAAALLAAPAAPAADETTQVHVDAQHTNAVAGSPLRPPLKLLWQADAGFVPSNVVIADGRVFFVNSKNFVPRLTALDLRTGAEIWSRTWPQRTTVPYGVAYENGRLFWTRELDADKHPRHLHVEAVEPATGAVIWQRDLPTVFGPGGAPTVADGELYVVSSDDDDVLYALRQSDGTDRWPPRQLADSAVQGSPTLDASNVYMWAGQHAYAFDRATGAERWHYDPGCCGGGLSLPAVLMGDRYYASGILDAATGQQVDPGGAGYPSWSPEGGVAWDSRQLRGFGPGYRDTRWTFAFDGEYLSPPLIAGGHAYTGTGTWTRALFALRVTDGGVAWCTDLPPGRTRGDVFAAAAGGGVLLVSNSVDLWAYESGSGSPGCAATSPTGPPQTTPAPGGGGPAAEGAALALTASRAKLRLGRSVTLTGRLTGAKGAVAIEADEWPFESSFRPVRAVVARDDGGFTLRYAPRRNVRLRARLDSQVSAPVDLYAELPLTVRRRDAGGPRARLEVRVRAPGDAAVRGRTVYGYLARGGAPWRRVAAGRLRLRAGLAAATLRYPPSRLTGRDRWLVCIREPRPDAYGRPRALDRLCGRRTLRR